jgi:ribosomal protein S18 acetylase RimI-like enzyme
MISRCARPFNVDTHDRRQNYGAALMNHMETNCLTEKIFTSTNLSNVPMQGLLAKLGYRLSGVIHNLNDDDDPELVYCKVLPSNRRLTNSWTGAQEASTLT